jgi:hypothetical protein
VRLLERWSNFVDNRGLWKAADWLLPVSPEWREILLENLRSDISVGEKIGWILFVWAQFMPIVGKLLGIQLDRQLVKEFRKSLFREVGK